jgi:hypothetical protein
MRRACDGIDEISRQLRPYLSNEVHDAVSRDLAEVLRGIEAGMHALADAERSVHDETISVAEATKLLFVARSHAETLIETGVLQRQSQIGNDLFVRRADVTDYKQKTLQAAQSWLASQTEDTKPPGL